MNYYFNNDAASVAGLETNPEGGLWPISTTPYSPAPKSAKQKAELVDRLQAAKTEFYVKAVATMAQARPGVLELMDAAMQSPHFKVGICSAATKEGFVTLVDSVVGKERVGKLDVILAGDDVSNKKPHPEIYLKAKDMIQMDPSQCIVVEDSVVGLKAAKAAGMRCIITYTSSTEKEDFKSLGADEVLGDLSSMTLEKLATYFKTAATSSTPSPTASSSSSSSPPPEAAAAETAPVAKKASKASKAKVSDTSASNEADAAVTTTKEAPKAAEAKVVEAEDDTPAVTKKTSKASKAKAADREVADKKEDTPAATKVSKAGKAKAPDSEDAKEEEASPVVIKVSTGSQEKAPDAKEEEEAAPTVSKKAPKVSKASTVVADEAPIPEKVPSAPAGWDPSVIIRK